ncbi:M23 family metallopeptidase [Sphingomonas sp.]|uniref:M23 family metallopeptidase n=1 Tax=Sphingomonas sp. TaxID=28214 RepID=UPI0025E34BAA|nr:M23 family metallopeptidase [Sphingomonas sp.]MBV9528210.1 M23 family metallopeptidase [Sphingomonas sp.]
MTQVLAATGTLFRDRDFFVHDGAQLRRFRLSAPVQAVFFLVLTALVGWSSYATARFLAPAPAVSIAPAAHGAGYSAEVAKLAAETDRRVQAVEERQIALAAALSVSSQVDDATLRRLGFYPDTSGQAGRGGPFESVGNPTFKALFNSWKKLDQLQDGVIAIPSDKPVKTDVSFTSGFGVRADPFHAGAAMHPGIDLAGAYGTPIYATADGTVLRSGWNNGGYGNMVEIDHGRGIVTRYGHMSAVLVQAGDHITRGQQIGRMGSTGRSTGNHLHYEVRIDGRPVNPIPFMKSTDYVIAMQKRSGAASMDQVAVGGPITAGR